MRNITRRFFIGKTVCGMAGLLLTNKAQALASLTMDSYPVVVSISNSDSEYITEAWNVIQQGGYALDAVEAGLNIVEADPETLILQDTNSPGKVGNIISGASIMNEKGETGTVSFLRCIRHPVSVSRLILENHKYTMLSGKGAQKFAIDNGFKKERLFAKEMRKLRKKSKRDRQASTVKQNTENQIRPDNRLNGMLAIDIEGRLCGGTTEKVVSGQIAGRVGAAAVIGAGMFADGKAGAAITYGSDEIILNSLAAFLAVEFIRNGLTPDEACNAVIARLIQKIPDPENHQVAVVAFNRKGQIGAASFHSGFNYDVVVNGIFESREAGSWYKRL